MELLSPVTQLQRLPLHTNQEVLDSVHPLLLVVLVVLEERVLHNLPSKLTRVECPPSRAPTPRPEGRLKYGGWRWRARLFVATVTTREGRASFAFGGAAVPKFTPAVGRPVY